MKTQENSRWLCADLEDQLPVHEAAHVVPKARNRRCLTLSPGPEIRRGVKQQKGPGQYGCPESQGAERDSSRAVANFVHVDDSRSLPPLATTVPAQPIRQVALSISDLTIMIA